MRIEYLLKEIRKSKNMTLKELSIKSGVSNSHLSDIENGKKEPGFFIMARIAKALDVKTDDLYRLIN